MRVASEAGAELERYSRSTVAPAVYIHLRAVFSLVVLFRYGGPLSAWLGPDHASWSSGFAFDSSSQAPSSPVLVAPLLSHLELVARHADAWVALRTAAAVAFGLSIWPRWSGIALALSSWLLLASDRFHYLHHLQLLSETALVLALCPTRAWSAWRGGLRLPAWPLLVVRAHLLGIYCASGVAKCSGAWWSGLTLSELRQFRFIHGDLWKFVTTRVGAAPLGVAVCLVELGLPALLVWRRTRIFALVLAAALHLVIAVSWSRPSEQRCSCCCWHSYHASNLQGAPNHRSTSFFGRDHNSAWAPPLTSP